MRGSIKNFKCSISSFTLDSNTLEYIFSLLGVTSLGFLYFSLFNIVESRILSAFSGSYESLGRAVLRLILEISFFFY